MSTRVYNINDNILMEDQIDYLANFLNTQETIKRNEYTKLVNESPSLLEITKKFFRL